jgi:hypothetical protein
VEPDRWEYQNLIMTRWLEDSDWKVNFTLYRGDEDDVIWDGSDSECPRPQALLNAWGNDGWELVGPPFAENMIATERERGFSAHAYTVGRWVLLSYWMKRRVSVSAPDTLQP